MFDSVISLDCGKIKGHEHNKMIEFLGIPYAKPPIGNLRFKRAVKADPWEGVFDAKEYGSPSIQVDQGKLRGSEDCLTLNIFRPLEGENLPVFVYIHGGGFCTGAASDGLTDGTSFVKDGLIYVSIQYRLNVLGFFDFTTYPGCEDFDSNCGVSDQLLALQWIHDNIQAFGGNPENITIDGESAGAASVLYMMACPSAKGLFQKAIAQSALPNCICSHEHARKNVDLFIKGMGWTENDLPKLKTIDAVELQKGYAYMAEHHQTENPGNFLPAAVFDDLLPETPIDAIAHGSADGIKLIIGSNHDEGTMFVHPENSGFPNSWNMIEKMFASTQNESFFASFQDFYNSLKKENELDPFIHFATHYAFEVPSIKIAMNQNKFSSDVWLYRLEFISKSCAQNGMKASHVFDLPLSFANREFNFSKFVYGEESEETLSILEHEFHDAWVSFAKTGNPGDAWKRFSGDEPNIRIIDLESKSMPFDRQDLMNLWGDLKFFEKY